MDAEQGLILGGPVDGRDKIVPVGHGSADAVREGHLGIGGPLQVGCRDNPAGPDELVCSWPDGPEPALEGEVNVNRGVNGLCYKMTDKNGNLVTLYRDAGGRIDVFVR